MTKASLICNLMEEHGNDWRNFMASKYPDITIKDVREDDPNNPYVLLYYGIGANFNDPVVKEARGIIINEKTRDVACWAFNKFGRYDEPYADQIDWSTASVQSKIDGSMMKLWWDEYHGKWEWATSGMIYAKDAYIRQDSDISFQTIIDKCETIDHINELIRDGLLNKDLTYIFELISPETTVVIKYDVYDLIHIGTRNIRTGKEINEDIGMSIVTKHPLTNLNECISQVEKLNTTYDGKIAHCNNEGFVVVDAQYHRIKVKSSIYLILHHIMDLKSTKAVERLIKLIYENKIRIPMICEDHPECAHILKYYDYKVTEFLYSSKRILDSARNLYKHIYGCDVKPIGKLLQNHPYKGIVFKAGLDGNRTVQEALDMMNGTPERIILKKIGMYNNAPIEMFTQAVLSSKCNNFN